MTALRAPMERMSKSISKFVDVSGLRTLQHGWEWIGRAASFALKTMVAIVPVMGAITGAASIAGMVRLVSQWAAWSHTLDETASRIGITSQQLQQFENTATLAGGNADDMAKSLTDLHDASVKAVEGDTQTMAMFNSLGINIRDVNGHLRTAADLFPEVLQKIEAMKDPTDRARYATELLGGSGAKLVQDFRAAHRSFADYFTDAGKYTTLTDQQKGAIQSFTEAQGKARVAFDTLGQQITATLAQHFTPFVNALSEWVTKNQPAIVAAVGKLADEFANWLQGIDWSKVQQGGETLLKTLQLIVNNIDTIKTVAEVVAGLFVVKWGVDVVKAIGSVATAFGVAGGAAAGGTGLLGALGIMAFTIKGINEGLTETNTLLQRMFNVKPEEIRKQAEAAGAGLPPWLAWMRNLPGYPEWASRQVQGTREAPFPAGTAPRGTAGIRGMPGTQAGAAVAPISATVTPQAKALLQTIGGGESGGYDDPYHVLFGGGSFTGNQFPQWQGANVGGQMTHAAGRYQFQPATFKEAQQALNLPDFSPASQDKAAWWLAQRDYRQRTGGDLSADLNDPSKAKQISTALQPTWTSAGSDTWANALQMRERQAAMTPAAPPTPAAAPVQAAAAQPANGNVDVTITHKNAPAGATASATGSGDVTVAPPKREFAGLTGP